MSTKIGEELPIHNGVYCNGCNGPVIGMRYKCSTCYDFDLCDDCEKKGIHNKHTLIKIPKKNEPVTSESQFVHQGVYCNHCNGPVIGTRFKCNTCFDYDLCERCEKKGIHKEHTLVKISYRLSTTSNQSVSTATPTPQSHTFMNHYLNYILAPLTRGYTTVKDEEQLKTIIEYLKNLLEPLGIDVTTFIDLHIKNKNNKNNTNNTKVETKNLPIFENDPEQLKIIGDQLRSHLESLNLEASYSIQNTITCDGCSDTIIGTRYRCSTCFDFDLCLSCEKKGIHKEHSLIKVTKRRELTKDSQVNNFKWCSACNDPIIGTKFKCTTCIDHHLCEHCERKGSQKQHSFMKMPGAGEKDTSKYIICDGCNNHITGKRFKCSTCSNFDLCEDCEKRNVHSEHVLVKHSEKNEKTNEEPIIHEGVYCNHCDGPVIGSRYKCNICFDYDLCDRCEKRGVHKEHTLFRIANPSRLSTQSIVAPSLKPATTNSFQHFLNNFRFFANNNKMAYNDFYSKTYKNQQFINAAPYLANNLCLTSASAATRRLCSLMNDNPNFPDHKLDARNTAVLTPNLTNNFDKMKINNTFSSVSGSSRNTLDKINYNNAILDKSATSTKSKEAKKLDEFIEDSDYEAFVKSFADIDSDDDNDLIEREIEKEIRSSVLNDTAKSVDFRDDKFFSNFLKSDAKRISNKN